MAAIKALLFIYSNGKHKTTIASCPPVPSSYRQSDWFYLTVAQCSVIIRPLRSGVIILIAFIATINSATNAYLSPSLQKRIQMPHSETRCTGRRPIGPVKQSKRVKWSALISSVIMRRRLIETNDTNVPPIALLVAGIDFLLDLAHKSLPRYGGQVHTHSWAKLRMKMRNWWIELQCCVVWCASVCDCY